MSRRVVLSTDGTFQWDDVEDKKKKKRNKIKEEGELDLEEESSSGESKAKTGWDDSDDEEKLRILGVDEREIKRRKRWVKNKV